MKPRSLIAVLAVTLAFPVHAQETSTTSPSNACETLKDVQAKRHSSSDTALWLAGAGTLLATGGTAAWAAAARIGYEADALGIELASEIALKDTRRVTEIVASTLTEDRSFDSAVKNMEARARLVLSAETASEARFHKVYGIVAAELSLALQRASDRHEVAHALVRHVANHQVVEFVEEAFHKGLHDDTIIRKITDLLIQNGKAQGASHAIQAAMRSILYREIRTGLQDNMAGIGIMRGYNVMLRFVQAGSSLSGKELRLADSLRVSRGIIRKGKLALAAGTALDVAAALFYAEDAKAATLKDSYRENPVLLLDLPDDQACAWISRDDTVRERFVTVANLLKRRGKGPVNQSVDPSSAEGPQLSSAFDADLKEMKGNADAQAIQGAFHEIAKEEAAAISRRKL